ncbi:MAG: hypothetical protein WBD64_07695 [Candidatus Zixiibacteriota bacterium]
MEKKIVALLVMLAIVLTFNVSAFSAKLDFVRQAHPWEENITRGDSPHDGDCYRGGVRGYGSGGGHGPRLAFHALIIEIIADLRVQAYVKHIVKGKRRSQTLVGKSEKAEQASFLR